MTEIISLEKDDLIPLDKAAGQHLKTGTIGLGWDMKSALKDGEDFDLDVSALLLDANGKVITPKHFVFYRNLVSPEGSVTHNGDNLTGEGDGDDEQILVNIDKVPAEVQRILILVSIFKGEQRGQTFSQLANAYVRVVDTTDGIENELMRLDLKFEGLKNTVFNFGELAKGPNGAWFFQATGEGLKPGYPAVLSEYGIKVG